VRSQDIAKYNRVLFCTGLEKLKLNVYINRRFHRDMLCVSSFGHLCLCIIVIMQM